VEEVYFMRRVSLREANQNFSSCIAEVESGERLILLRRGKPVAEIVPYSRQRRDPKREAALQELISIMEEGIPMGGVPPTRDEMHERV
jgi:prevent-host-death family protein